ncbi:UPF0602 protein C4orf47 homolog [Paramacrobiotus metropolitanus]|uniref:UPF0602 protein C4orf47 homolog n=1 Tax=Paramacrobiotus metropolitanus TaxID=2943436 RepID=UPI002445761F|nr:UPF0602 protein C4orf47 homolog [Paramacrobiotus metropolitanus]
MPSELKIPDLKAKKEPGYRSDMEKFGLFLDPGILKPQTPYLSLQQAAEFRTDMAKGKQFLGAGRKIKAGLRDCYFDKVERRIFEGDGTFDPVRARRQANIAARKLDLAKRWVPAKGRTSICGVGNYYGTFAGRVDAFSAALRERPPKGKYYPCFVAVYPKFGSYGFNGYTFAKHPEHKPDPYDGEAVNKDYVEAATTVEASRRRNRKAYVTSHKSKNYFDKNPYLVANPPTEPPTAPGKPVPAFLLPKAFRPPGRMKPMKDMKFWGTFHSVDYIPGEYKAPMNPFRLDFYGKQQLKAPYVPPAGTKSVLATPVSFANMPRQMDTRRSDKQELVYSVATKKAVAFPGLETVTARLKTKGITISPKLYSTEPDPFLPRGQPTIAPASKPWFC